MLLFASNSLEAAFKSHFVRLLLRYHFSFWPVVLSFGCSLVFSFGARFESPLIGVRRRMKRVASSPTMNNNLPNIINTMMHRLWASMQSL